MFGGANALAYHGSSEALGRNKFVFVKLASKSLARIKPGETGHGHDALVRARHVCPGGEPEPAVLSKHAKAPPFDQQSPTEPLISVTSPPGSITVWPGRSLLSEATHNDLHGLCRTNNLNIVCRCR